MANIVPTKKLIGVCGAGRPRQGGCATTEPELLPHLDAMRFIAALAVLAGHVRAHLLVNFDGVSSPTLIDRAVYFGTGFGHEAVVIFFVLSGFLIARSVRRAFAASRWSWSHYLLQRSVRIYVVLLPALLLCALWDQLGLTLFGSQGTLYGGELRGASAVALPLAESSTLLVFMGNMMFLQGWMVPSFGTNGVLWSLAYEAWFYVAFPAAFAIYHAKNWRDKTLNTTILLSALLLAGPFGLPYLLLWLLGALIAWVRSDRVDRSSRRGLFIAGMVLISALLASRIGWASGYTKDVIVALGAGAFIVCAPHARGATQFWYKCASAGAAMSYSLYLFHAPLLIFVQSAILRENRMEPSPASYGICLAIMSLLIVYAFILSKWTEAKTSRVRNFLAAQFIRTCAVKTQ